MLSSLPSAWPLPTVRPLPPQSPPQPLTQPDIFPNLLTHGQTRGQWEYVRRTANKWSREGLTNVNDALMSCYEEAGRPAADVQTVTAGSSVGFASQAPITHIGPVLFYMARVPDGQDVDSWEPTGDVWFKIAQEGPAGDWSWPTQGERSSFHTF